MYGGITETIQYFNMGQYLLASKLRVYSTINKNSGRSPLLFSNSDRANTLRYGRCKRQSTVKIFLVTTPTRKVFATGRFSALRWKRHFLIPLHLSCIRNQCCLGARPRPCHIQTHDPCIRCFLAPFQAQTEC